MTDQEVTRLVTPGEIAEMAGRTPAAVSNWRANPNLQFPDPTGGSAARPLFSESEIIKWLKARGYEITTDRGERQIWSVFNGLRGAISIEALTDALLAVMSARFMTHTDRKIEGQWTKVAVTPFGNTIFADYAHLVHLANSTERFVGLADLPSEFEEDQEVAFSALIYAVNSLKFKDFEYISNLALKRLAGAQARSAGQYGLAESKVSTILASLIDGRSGTIYDPACGIGETLAQIQRKSTIHTRLVGQDVNQQALRIARQRNLFAHGSTRFAQADVLAHDPDPELRADAVVVEPPLGMRWDNPHAVADPRWNFGLPQKSSSELLWIQHAIYHLAPGGHGYVVTGGNPTFTTASSSKTVRSNLIRHGCVEAIIGLPGKLLPHTSIPLFLWVLRPPASEGTNDDVLLVDGSSESEPENGLPSWLTLGLGDDPDAHPPYARVSIDDLVTSEGVSLQPHRWIERAAVDESDVVGGFHQALTALTSARDDIAELDVAGLVPGTFSAPRIVAIRDLLKQGAMSLLRGYPLRGDDGERLMDVGVTARQVRDGLPLTSGSVNEAHLAGGSKIARTQPLDILFTTMNEVRVAIDFDGGRVLDNGVFALRVDPVIFDPAYVARCLTAQWNKSYQSGTTIQRADPKALEIVVIPISEQRALADLLGSLSHVRSSARDVVEAAESIETNLFEAVRNGIDIARPDVDAEDSVGPADQDGPDESEETK